MLEISRNGKRVYFTNSLYSTGDDQFYADCLRAAMVTVDVSAASALVFDDKFWVEVLRGYRADQIRFEGGDCSTDYFCYPSV